MQCSACSLFVYYLLESSELHGCVYYTFLMRIIDIYYLMRSICIKVCPNAIATHDVAYKNVTMVYIT